MVRWVVAGLLVLVGCGAEEAIRREVTIGEGAMTIVFVAREAESHVALAVATSRGVDEDAILDSFAIE